MCSSPFNEEFEFWPLFNIPAVSGPSESIIFSDIVDVDIFLSYLQIVLKVLAIIVPLLVSVAYYTLAERKILGAIQRRRGPNVVGTYGLLQPLSDGFKLLIKEIIIPSSSNKIIFSVAPMITFIVSLIGWSFIPFGNSSILAQIDMGLLYLIGTSSIGVYGIIMAGWSSNSKYPFLGGLRSTAQMISYELCIGFTIIALAIMSNSFDIYNLIYIQKYIWFSYTFFPLFLIFCACGLAETNRHPFDLPEAEAELVSGYNVEYSAMTFALFSLGEYANMLMMGALTAILFLGGWWSPLFFPTLTPSFWLGIKIVFSVIFFVVMRAGLPRFRYDQLMSLGWKTFLPITLGYLVLIIGIVTVFDIHTLPKGYEYTF